MAVAKDKKSGGRYKQPPSRPKLTPAGNKSAKTVGKKPGYNFGTKPKRLDMNAPRDLQYDKRKPGSAKSQGGMANSALRRGAKPNKPGRNTTKPPKKR